MSSEGQNFLTTPTSVLSPSLELGARQSADLSSDLSTDSSTKTRVSSTSTKRKSKGTQALPIIRTLLSQSENWFEITSPDDYQYPGVFQQDHPRRVAFCSDVTSLPFYDASNEHFLFDDIQFGKGHIRGIRTTSMNVNGTEEDVCYKIAPCKGVKVCGNADCSYVTSTRESKACPNHPTINLELTKDCLVDFYYIWPKDCEDKRRWIGGLLRCGDMRDNNLHSHPLNPPAKIPVKVEADIRRALVENPRLKTSDIMIGMYINNHCIMHTISIVFNRKRFGIHAQRSIVGSNTQRQNEKPKTVNSA